MYLQSSKHLIIGSQKTIELQDEYESLIKDNNSSLIYV